MLEPGFSPERVLALEKDLRGWANRLIDGFIEEGQTERPVRVIARLGPLSEKVIDDLLKAQGMKKGDVVLVSIDGGPESYRRIKAQDSLLTATVGIPFERIGRTAVEKMNDIVVKKVPKNQAVNGPYLWMDAVLVDASNVDQMLK